MDKLRRSNKVPTALPQQELPVCKFCLEVDSSKMLIHPCRCEGSIKYVHHDCLKTWIITHNEDLDYAKCELCHYQYKMTYSIRNECQLSKESFRCNTKVMLLSKLILLALC